MNIFTSYEQWFLNTMDPIIQVSIAKYDLNMYDKLNRKIENYRRTVFSNNEEGRIKKDKMQEITNIAKLQLQAFPYDYNSMLRHLNELLRNYRQFYGKSTFQLEKEMTNIQKRKYGLLRWIRNNERSLHQLLQMELIKNNNGKSIRQKRNENNSRPQLINNWIQLVLKISKETMNNAYQRTNNEASLLKKRFTNGLRENNYNLSLFTKKKHLKTKECNYDFEPRTTEEQTQFLQEIEQKKRNNDKFSGRYDWDETIDMLGINQLSFLKTSNRGNTLENYFKNNYKIALKELINLYLMPIESIYNDIFLLYRENIMMCISFILYNNNIKINIEGQNVAKGLYGKVKENKNKKIIYKYENLRIMSETQRENGIKNNGTLFTKFYKKYPINSYVSTQVLFSYMIQKYLYELNKNFVPNIYDIKFDFENENKEPSLPLSENKEKKDDIQLSLTIMNKSNKNNRISFESSNLFEILFNTKLYTCENYIQFIKIILIKLCDILIYYQNKCFFVHRDLHVKNVVINYNINSNSNLIDNENIQVKIIDFSFSSILINNQSLVLSQFQYSNMKSLHNPTFTNSYFNKDWKKIDLKFFFTLFLFFFKPKGLKEFNIKNNNLIIFDNIERLIINIINIEPGYNERFDDFKKIGCFIDHKAFDAFLKKNNIFGESFNDNIFDPNVCKLRIIELLNNN